MRQLNWRITAPIWQDLLGRKVAIVTIPALHPLMRNRVR